MIKRQQHEWEWMWKPARNTFGNGCGKPASNTNRNGCGKPQAARTGMDVNQPETGMGWKWPKVEQQQDEGSDSHRFSRSTPSHSLTPSTDHNLADQDGCGKSHNRQCLLFHPRITFRASILLLSKQTSKAAYLYSQIVQLSLAKGRRLAQGLFTVFT